MILAPDGGRLRVVTQPDHARFAGELARLWRADGLPESPRREEILFAVREHDNGWREADAAPRVDPASGRPLDFLALPPGERREVWRRGTERYAASRPYAALLIAEHALAVLGDAADEEGRAFLGALTERRQALLEASGARPEEVASDYRFLDLGDRVSLAACAGWRDPVERHGVRIRPRDCDVLMQPFPLAGATTFRVACRFIADRPYRGDADLGGALAEARWQELAVRVAAE